MQAIASGHSFQVPLLHLNQGLLRYQRNRLLLGITRADLENSNRRRSRSDRSNYEPKKSAAAVHAGAVRLPGSRNDGLTFFLVQALDDGNFLIATRKKSTVTNILDLDHGRVVLNQQRN